MPSVDPYELLEAVEVLSKIPKDFYDKIVRFSKIILKIFSWLAMVGVNNKKIKKIPKMDHIGFSCEFFLKYSIFVMY